MKHLNIHRNLKLFLSLLICTTLLACSKSNEDPKQMFRDPKVVAGDLGMQGVSQCMAIVIIWSAGLATDKNIRSDVPEIRNNNNLLRLRQVILNL